MSTLPNTINIVIPVLNEEHYIEVLLNSLVGQNYKKFDVVVVDGNSTDNTVEVAKKYQNLLPLDIVTCDKRNVSRQRNVGAKKGSAPYILFLDSDVRIHQNFLKQLMHDLKDRDVANCWLIPISKKQIDKILYRLYNVFFLEFGKYVWPVAVGNNLFTTREMFEKIHGFDERIKTWEDVDFVQRAIDNGATFAVLRRPKIYASVRRFEMQGRFNYLMENIKGLQYAIRTGKMPTHINYPMGLDYSQLHMKKDTRQHLQKRLHAYYRNYTKKIKELLS